MTLWTFLTGRCDSLAPSGTALVPGVGVNATAVAVSFNRRSRARGHTPPGAAVSRSICNHHAIAATFDRHRGPRRQGSRPNHAARL